MLKSVIKITVFLILIFSLISSTNSIASNINQINSNNKQIRPINKEVLDPYIDLEVTVIIKEIRALDKIDILSKPDFFVKVYINDIEYNSKTWFNQKYINQTMYFSQDVPNNKENVSIKIQLWDKGIIKDRLCDISRNNESDPNSCDVELTYSLKTGHWHGKSRSTGDDYNIYDPLWFDKSGYGRLNGCDDFSYNTNDRDCEIWFDITQNDYDNDGIPYWTEANIYNKPGQCNPSIDDRGRDDDEDGIPIEWEHKWGHYFYHDWHHDTINHGWIYHPFIWNDHKNLDPDLDGLDNVEEYLTSEFGSNPFRQDILLEVDQMEIGKKGEKVYGAFIPDLTKELIRDAFSKHNIVFLIDDGCFGGGQTIPFDQNTSNHELQKFYFKYFMNNDSNYWRRGIFHYALIIYEADRHNGFAFSTTVDGEKYIPDSFQISTYFVEEMPWAYPVLDLIRRKTLNYEKQRAIAYAGVMMHETGHTLGLFGNPQNPGCDNPNAIYPRKDWWKFRNYRSCMSYNLVYCLVDYSDGSHGKNDFDDWEIIDLTRFQK